MGMMEENQNSDGWRSGDRDLEIGVGAIPNKRNASGPVFAINGASGGCELVPGKYAGGRAKFRPRNFSTYRAGRDFYLWVIANAFELSHVTASHNIKLVILFSEPNWSRNSDPGFAEGGEGNVFLSMNFWGNWHKFRRLLSLFVEKGALR